MSRRSPRRRISPRTVRRYRAIKNFMRRAFGSQSQPNFNTNSSISVGVSDLKHKIDGIEQQLNTVSKHCQDLACLEYSLRNATISSLSTKLQDNLEHKKSTESCTKSFREPETKVLYTTSQGRSGTPICKGSLSKVNICDDEDENKMSQNLLPVQNDFSNNKAKIRKKYERLAPIQEYEKPTRYRKKPVIFDKLPDARLKNSFHPSLINDTTRHEPEPGCSEARRHKRRNKIKYLEIDTGVAEQNHHFVEKSQYNNQRHRHHVGLDQDYIAEIIKRQYKPVKLLGRRESEFSQFSAPICRDQEFPVRNTVQEGSDLCSCCYKEHGRQRHSRYMCSNDLSDIRSICDTRLYSSRKHRRHTNYKKQFEDIYNDSEMYDVVPVKEKTSPKSRRKFVEDNMLMYDKYREVPPSPRTHRPQFNLQAQLHPDYDDEDNILPVKNLLRRNIKNSSAQNDGTVSRMSSEVFIHNKNGQKVLNSRMPSTPKQFNEECVGTAISSAQYPFCINEQTHDNNITLNTNTTELSTDKTDKALSEIKGILQNFLQEIKKETSQSEKLNSSAHSETHNKTDPQHQLKNESFAPCSLPPFIPPFANPCCYPILPFCPINCMQNGFVVPSQSQSVTCAACANKSKEHQIETQDRNKGTDLEEAGNETQKLIKEIHNLILQNPNSIKRNDLNTTGIKSHATSSMCGNAKPLKHDAKVGTPKMKCHSKSCEAIRSKEATDTRYNAYMSYSDTVLEKGSSEETTVEQSSSESEYSSESTVLEQKNGNKLKKMLRAIGILKKNKTNVIEERSDTSMAVEKTKPRQAYHQSPGPPFPQHVMNYNMHGQEYLHPPPIGPRQHHECNGHSPHCDPRLCYTPAYEDKKSKVPHGHFDEQHYFSPHYMPTPPFPNYCDPHYGKASPQVPLCLKEIEVKSIGTQSVRKMSLLQKLTNKIQVPQQQQEKELSDKQSAAKAFWKEKLMKEKNLRDKPASNLFDWKKVHEKAMQKTTDPLKFSYDTQKRLAAGDKTMRNAMLKKLFYKRNPFSPRNLLVRTILGKDPSSFGDPPKMYKPSLFV